MNKKEAGTTGEDKAGRLLAEQGFEIVKKNYKVKEGEIDIIGKKGKTVAFFEVKLRNNESFGHPISSLPKFRLERMSNAALRFVAENQEFVQFDMAFYLVTIIHDEVKFVPLSFD